MIEAPFRAATMAVPRGADRGAARGRPTRGRAIRLAAITRDADRKETIAASAHFLTKRRIHDVEAAARFDWTRRLNRGTRETTGSVRRSIEAVTEGLEGQAPGLHLNPPASPIAYSHPLIRGGARRHLLPRVGALTRAAERLHDSSFNIRSRNAQRNELQRRESRFTRFQVSADNQESHWNPEATSFTGVRGLMMLTQETANAVGVTDRLNPRQSVLGGTRYLTQLRERINEDIGRPDGFLRDTEGTREWLAEQLRPFGGDMERAAVFAMRLTAARFGLLRGPAQPSIAQVLDESLWERVRSAGQAGCKRWWQFWK